MRTRLAVLALVLSAALTGCSTSDDKPTASSGPSAPASSTSTTPRDGDGQAACDKVKTHNAANGFEPDLTELAAIADQGKYATAPFVQTAAVALGGAVELAKAAAGAGDETRMKLAASTKAIELETECTRAGYYKAG